MDNSTSDEDHEVPFFDTYATSLYIFDDMNRVEAENLLRVGDVGTFLIRKSSKKNSYSLSLRLVLVYNQLIWCYLGFHWKMKSQFYIS